MTFDKDYWKRVVEDAANRLDVDAAEVVDSLQDGLMKVHEVVGHVSDSLSNHIMELGLDMQDGIMLVSEKLESLYYVDDTPKAKHFAEPGKVQDEGPQQTTHLVEGKPELRPAFMNRGQLEDYVCKAYGLDKDTLAGVADNTLRNAVDVDQTRRNQKYNHKQ